MNKCKTKSVRQRNKKYSRTSPDAKCKKFSLTKQKLDLERTMSEMEKQFPKNQIKKIKKKKKINVKIPHVNRKPLERNGN